MKRHIIAYCGKQNSGKTTTLTLLHNVLSKTRIQGDNHQLSIPSPDFCSTFIIKGFVICISSAGDDAAATRRGLEYFEDEQGHMLITAARTRGETVNLLREYEAQHSDVSITWISVEYASPAEQPKCNELAASILFRKTEEGLMDFLFSAAQARVQRLMKCITDVQTGMRSSNGKTYVLYDTCAYRNLVSYCATDHDIVEIAANLRQQELAAGLHPVVSALTLWELIAHITETDEQGEKTDTRRQCEQALRFIHHHVQGAFTAVPEFDAAIALAANADEPLQVIRPERLDNAYNISTCLYAVAHSIENIIAEGAKYAHYDIVERLAADMVEYKEHINTILQSCVNDGYDGSLDEFSKALEYSMAHSLLHGVIYELQTIENYKVMFPITSSILAEQYPKWYRAIKSRKCGANWARSKKIANIVVDAIQLAPVNAKHEANATIFITADRGILNHQTMLSSSNHILRSLEEHKKTLGI